MLVVFSVLKTGIIHEIIEKQDALLINEHPVNFNSYIQLLLRYIFYCCHPNRSYPHNTIATGIFHKVQL